jgi:tetratricopeptide (TPR) repeat protein
MFKRKYFEQSMKCFQMSGDDDLYKKSQANAMADESTKEIIEVESEKNYIKNKLYAYADMSKQDLKRARTKLKNQEIKALENFCRAGQLFNEAELYKQAGQCFFSGREYAKAEQCFRKINMVKQVAESLYMQHQYIEAGEHFAEGGDYLKAIECYDLVNDWEAVLKIINKFADVIPEADRQALIRKYAALCLEDLVQEIEFENEVPENGGEKKPELVQIIHEKDSDEEEDSELSE